mmetsp:Transcript_29848/g.55165  ORF Transcript_29848/g.55165 Transcript_29848/m.55165 type:complete len:199 (+) Transcript_29848:79-675(+)
MTGSTGTDCGESSWSGQAPGSAPGGDGTGDNIGSMEVPSEPPVPPPRNSAHVGSAQQNQGGNRPLSLEADRTFSGFVALLLRSSAPELYSAEQLDRIQSPVERRRARLVLKECRTNRSSSPSSPQSTGGSLDLNCICREACPVDYRRLASCLRNTPEDSGANRCAKEFQLLKDCVRSEMQQFLISVSPGFEGHREWAR